jgi:peptidoglycan hydrolase-like protein with peptidoglycan-binding domain
MCLASLELSRQLRRIAMARIVTNSLLLLFLVSGCGWLSKEEAQAPKAPEPTPAPVSSTPVEAASYRTSSATIAANTTLSKEELRMLQARLKAAGFYVGPIDGIVGPKTKSGLFRLQAACANLKDLLETSATGAQAAKLDHTNSSLKSEETRLIQVRLKDTGFDPGPIDGVLGAKTRAAFLRFEAGCTMLNNLPPTLHQELQTADKRTSVPAEEKKYPVAAKSMRIEADKMTLSSEKIRQEQLRLRDAGFDPGPIDGILGPKTKAAMQRYQNSFALKNSQ